MAVLATLHTGLIDGLDVKVCLRSFGMSGIVVNYMKVIPRDGLRAGKSSSNLS